MTKFKESDVMQLVEGILDAQLEFFDNPNGPYEYTCPFCCAEERVGGHQDTPHITTIKHDLDCIYLVAKDMNIGAD
jgi:hypothetical protein